MGAGDDAYFKTRLSYEPSRDAVWKVITEYLQQFVPEDAVVLELGAGYCSFINHVRAREKHALDRSPVIKRHAANDVTTHICDCENLRRFKRNQFNLVFSSFLYEHLTRGKLNRVMTQLQRILTPGGILMTLLPNFKYIARHYFDDYTHIQIFSHLSFADYLTASGFKVTEVQGRFLPYSFKSRLPKWPALTRLYLSLPYRPLAGNMLVIAENQESWKKAPDTPSGTHRPAEKDHASKSARRTGRDTPHRPDHSPARKPERSVPSERNAPPKQSAPQKQSAPPEQSEPPERITSPKRSVPSERNGPPEQSAPPESNTPSGSETRSPRKPMPGQRPPTEKNTRPERNTPAAGKKSESARRSEPGDTTAGKSKKPVTPSDETYRETAKDTTVDLSPSKGNIRHGRRPRRNAADHYGIDINKETPEDEKASWSDVETFPIKDSDHTSGPIRPDDVRTPKKKK